ncbi:DUF4861 family protein [Flavivirga aquimarina]|uniref:DUF4861 family protein n=1 Tax=Flavivirga aquimarina TaxID=2027862 RepID=A0ABT8W557_9FLAO|nr:DUF4861 family protein [Flavivirga aquimarina]MDO5968240.1 DUF4861 family protein [Flavivirga aquimarina]
MNALKTITALAAILLIQSCKEKEEKKIFIIKNDLNIERSFETVVLTKDVLKVDDLSAIGIKDIKTGQLEVTQTVDNDGDGVMDDILFQPQVPANTEKEYEVVTVTAEEEPEAPEYCYSRFVPERTDDYTWENNKVAFRVYGPTAQKMVEDNVSGGTLSSGVDAWLKKVEYPIINNWYKKNTEKPGAYHEPSPEGLDNFHVGISRGVGGLAVKKDSTYYFSKNYIEWRTITTGPIRTSFYLKYADWDAHGNKITESKIVSLDLGSNLSKFEVSIGGTDSISTGLTLHEKDGEVSGNEKAGWVSYWQPHADSELGTAIIAPVDYFVNYETYDTEQTDLSNAYANLKVVNGKVIYYAGFGWKESGQFNNKQEWEAYLNTVSKKIKNPLTVKLKS